MEATPLSARSGAARLDRAQFAVLAAILAAAAVAWVVTSERMGGMEPMPGMSLGSFGFYLGIWVVMMAAMMFPAIAPTVLSYEQLRDGRRAGAGRATSDATALFVLGYLAVWTAAGLIAYAVYELVREIDPAFLGWDEAGRYVAGGVIVLAGVYQLTSLKRACLDQCRAPKAFLSEFWREGRTGALELGVRYGTWCFGCSWALMAALFAVGVMSLGWMLVIAALLAAERLLPWPTAARRAVAVCLLVLGLGVALVPGDVPGFTEPDPAMEGGGGQGESMEMMR